MTDYMVSCEIVGKKANVLDFCFFPSLLYMVELDNFPVSGGVCV